MSRYWGDTEDYEKWVAEMDRRRRSAQEIGYIIGAVLVTLLLFGLVLLGSWLTGGH